MISAPRGDIDLGMLVIEMRDSEGQRGTRILIRGEMYLIIIEDIPSADIGYIF
jgi:hypothetical protein